MSAVQSPHRSEDGDAEADDSAVAEENQRTAGLVHRAIRSDEQVSAEQILVQLQGPLEIRRTGFFFAFENHF